MSKSRDRACRINTDVQRIEPVRAHPIHPYVNTFLLTVFLREIVLHPRSVGVRHNTYKVERPCVKERKAISRYSTVH